MKAEEATSTYRAFKEQEAHYSTIKNWVFEEVKRAASEGKTGIRLSLKKKCRHFDIDYTGPQPVKPWGFSINDWHAIKHRLAEELPNDGYGLGIIKIHDFHITWPK